MKAVNKEIKKIPKGHFISLSKSIVDRRTKLPVSVSILYDDNYLSAEGVDS